MKKKRRRSPAWYALQQMWHRAILPRLDKFERKLDKLMAEREKRLKSVIGFEHPPAEDE